MNASRQENADNPSGGGFAPVTPQEFGLTAFDLDRALSVLTQRQRISTEEYQDSFEGQEGIWRTAYVLDAKQDDPFAISQALHARGFGVRIVIKTPDRQGYPVNVTGSVSEGQGTYRRYVSVNVSRSVTDRDIWTFTHASNGSFEAGRRTLATVKGESGVYSNWSGVELLHNVQPVRDSSTGQIDLSGEDENREGINIEPEQVLLVLNQDPEPEKPLNTQQHSILTDATEPHLSLEYLKGSIRRGIEHFHLTN